MQTFEILDKPARKSASIFHLEKGEESTGRHHRSAFHPYVDIAIAYLLERLHPNSSPRDELILLQGQWSSFSHSNRIGALSHDNTELSASQIRERIMSLINSLTEQDIKP